MERKEYKSPGITVLVAAVQHILAASGGVSVGSGSGNSYSKNSDIEFEDRTDANFGDVDID